MISLKLPRVSTVWARAPGDISPFPFRQLMVWCHGNVSALLRENTEDEMKSAEEKIVTGATVTLELGIDIGSLDQVVQVGAPLNVSSFAILGAVPLHKIPLVRIVYKSFYVQPDPLLSLVPHRGRTVSAGAGVQPVPGQGHIPQGGAFLPVLTQLYERPSASVGVVYISPLKALINDQFKRLDLLLADSGIPVTKWHGDASATQKNKLMKQPQGILQITPESLESLVTNKRGACMNMFSDLRFVIIDEVHYFMRDGDIHHSHRGGRPLIELGEHRKKSSLRLPGGCARRQKQIIVAVRDFIELANILYQNPGQSPAEVLGGNSFQLARGGLEDQEEVSGEFVREGV